MTTTTPRPFDHAARPRGTRAAFSLTELLVATTLAGILMAAVLSAFLFIARTSISIRNYAELETQARNGLETFAQDVRMASGATWNNANSLTLNVVQGGAAISVTYVFNPTASTLSRTSPTGTETIITGIRSFAFNAYNIDTTAISLASPNSATNRATKQIQISLETQRVSRSLALSTNKVISARFVLRNKRVGA